MVTPTMLKRGVERVFAVFVKKGVVAEWLPDERSKANAGELAEARVEGSAEDRGTCAGAAAAVDALHNSTSIDAAAAVLMLFTAAALDSAELSRRRAENLREKGVRRTARVLLNSTLGFQTRLEALLDTFPPSRNASFASLDTFPLPRNASFASLDTFPLPRNASFASLDTFPPRRNAFRGAKIGC